MDGTIVEAFLVLLISLSLFMVIRMLINKRARLTIDFKYNIA